MGEANFRPTAPEKPTVEDEGVDLDKLYLERLAIAFREFCKGEPNMSTEASVDMVEFSVRAQAQSRYGHLTDAQLASRYDFLFATGTKQFDDTENPEAILFEIFVKQQLLGGKDIMQGLNYDAIPKDTFPRLREAMRAVQGTRVHIDLSPWQVQG